MRKVSAHSEPVPPLPTRSQAQVQAARCGSQRDPGDVETSPTEPPKPRPRRVLSQVLNVNCSLSAFDQLEMKLVLCARQFSGQLVWDALRSEPVGSHTDDWAGHSG